MIDNVGTHVTHCCVKHLCKYSDNDCPVASGEVQQEGPCENCADDPMKVCIILRGLSGAGKSYRARQHATDASDIGLSSIIVSADDFFTRGGVYAWFASGLQRAHEDCFTRFVDALIGGTNVVIVDNTNARVREFEMYAKVALLAGYDLRVDEIAPIDDAQTRAWHARCVHNVPLATVLKRAAQWEAFDLPAFIGKFNMHRGGRDQVGVWMTPIGSIEDAMGAVTSAANGHE